MTATVDFLGRSWPHDKLDRLLDDADVRDAIDQMDRVARGSGRSFIVARARDWATARGRSEAGFALLLVLRRRLFAQRMGRAA